MTGRMRLWSPPAPEDTDNLFDTISPRRADLYVTVDEIEGDLVRLVISPWPSVDGDGRLVFPPPSAGPGDSILEDPSEMEVVMSLPLLQETVNQHRTESGQRGLARHLRVSDTFWVRGDVDDKGVTGRLLDVTYGARAEAKAAMAWAVTGSMAVPPDLITGPAEIDETDRALGAMAETEQEPARPTIPGAVASPSV